MNRRRPKPDEAALTVAIAHLERDAAIAMNNAEVALREQRLGNAAALEQNRDRLMWVIDFLVWRRTTDAKATAQFEARCDREVMEEALANREYAASSSDARLQESRLAEAGM